MKERTPTLRVLGAGLSLLFVMPFVQASAGERPNILWITCEDISPNLGCYGDVYALTPNLDRLAAEGVRYANAFAPVGVCAPARSSLILGMYAPSAGTHHMRSKIDIPEEVPLYSQCLRRAGYYCTNCAKEDYNLRSRPADAWDASGRKASWRDRKPGQPFFAVENLTCTHESQIRLEEEGYRLRTRFFEPREFHDPALAPVPPYHPDTPEVRKDWARYADMITYMDKMVGECLKQLEREGLAEDTIVFFYSDHGAGMPRSKRWLYDSSLRVPLIVRFPEKYRHLAPGGPGSVTDRLVSFVDFGPTVLSLAGVPVPETMQGKPFLGAQAVPPRDYCFGFRDRMDERYDMIRSVRDKRYHYLRNYHPHKVYAQHISYMYQMPTMQAWQRAYDEGKLVGPQKLFFEEKPAEELYDTWADPHEVHNLADHPDYRAVKLGLKGALEAWMLEIHDLGFLPEAEMEARSRGERITPYALARDPGRYDQRRVMAAADLASLRDPERIPDLVEGLRDGDSAVRYWAAAGLAALGERAAPARAELVEVLADPAPSVRLAAAEALCNLGGHDRALPVLGEALHHRSEWVRLHAVNILDGIGEKARPALEDIIEAGGKESKSYPARIYPRIMERLKKEAPSGLKGR